MIGRACVGSSTSTRRHECASSISSSRTFAKTGNPNSGRLPVWPKFDVVSRAFIQFTDAGPISGEGLRRPFCDLYFEHVKLLIAS